MIGIGFTLLTKDKFSLDTVKNTVRMSSVLLPIFLTNIYMIIWGDEFSHRTINNLLVVKKNRFKIFVIKYFLTFALTLIFSLVIILACSFTTWFKIGGFPLLEILKILAAQLPIYFAVTSFGTLIFIGIPTSYAAVAVFISLAMIGDNFISSIISTFLPNLEYFLDTLFFTNLSNIVDFSIISPDTFRVMMLSGIIYGIFGAILSYMIFSIKEFK
ncbi:hypothetical protein D920_00398 [Enterococcus faecalis 13-SD-W-01]|nr:hypothetical protein D920_00398 [Enterococcus faecalis 13-SD-W-01]